MAVVVVVLSRADVVHLVCRAALHAAGDGLLTSQLFIISIPKILLVLNN